MIYNKKIEKNKVYESYIHIFKYIIQPCRHLQLVNLLRIREMNGKL